MYEGWTLPGWALCQVGQVGLCQVGPGWGLCQVARLASPGWRQVDFDYPARRQRHLGDKMSRLTLGFLLHRRHAQRVAISR